MKNSILTALALIGAGISAAFGGWDQALAALLVLMAADYVTGLAAAGLFHASQKTETGRLSSRACWQGLARKGTVLLFVLIAHQLDRVLGSSCVRDGVCIAYIANETLSIIENAGLMGVPIPETVSDAVEMLKSKHK